MVSKMMHQTRVTILLSLNVVVILIVGVMIYSAINLNGGIELKVVSERSDVVAGGVEQLDLLTPEIALIDSPTVSTGESSGNGGGSSPLGGGGIVTNPGGNNTGSGNTGSTTSTGTENGNGNSSVKRGELWSETAMTIYQTADIDICVASGLTGLGEMYWQTSNPAVIKGFLNQARTWLGYSVDRCRYPVIAGTGTTTITAGTYDGARHDSITVTVIAPPVEQWKRDVLTLVNQERAKYGLAALAWGTHLEAAANTRVKEIMTSYSHTRPNGQSFQTVCPAPTDGKGGNCGENLNAGSAAVSPQTVVASWMNSPSHRANILNPGFKYLAVGFIFDPNSTNKTYWSQTFSEYR